MLNPTGLPTINPNPYLYTQPQALPAPIVAAPPAPVAAAVNNFYPLNTPITLTGQGQGDFFTSSTTGAPVTNYTTTTLPVPFVAAKPSTTDFNNQNFQIQLTDALNPQPKKVEPPAAVMANPFEYQAQTTTIPGYNPPGGNFSMLA